MPVGVAEVSQIFLGDAHVLQKFLFFYFVPETTQDPNNCK
jgi:hypothetical protein